MIRRGELAPVSVALLLLAAVLAGCGGANGDQALAEQAVLREDDLPSAGEGLSWYVDPPDEEALLNRCADFDLPGLSVKARASGDFFLASQVGAVTSLSAIYEDSAHQALRRLADHTRECIQAERDPANWSGSLRPENVKVREISLPKLGGSSRAYQIEYELGDLPNWDEVVLLQKGRSVALLYFEPNLSCGGPLCGTTPKQEAAFVHGTLVELARAIAARM